MDLHRSVAGIPLNAIPLTSFWPIVGGHYDGQLLVIGRAVNSWRTEWAADQARTADRLSRVVADAIAVNTIGPDPMDWAIRLWGNEGSRFDGFAESRYNTARSAFWRVLRDLSVSGPWARPAETWSGHLAWTNLYKVAPAAGCDPRGDLLGVQRGSAAQLLAREVEELAPRTVIALTGRAWFEPFGR
jgi:hypothetical protein